MIAVTTPAQQAMGEIAPKLAESTDQVFFAGQRQSIVSFDE